MDVSVSRPPVRAIAAATVAALAAAGRLPTVPARIESLVRNERKRDPTMAEIERYEWFAADRGTAVVGVMALREVYDLHTNADVLQVDYIAGTARACSDLLTHVATLCEQRSMIAIGSVDVGNPWMARLIMRKGFGLTKMTFTGRG